MDELKPDIERVGCDGSGERVGLVAENKTEAAIDRDGCDGSGECDGSGLRIATDRDRDEAAAPPSDYPVPAAMTERREYEYDDSEHPAEKYPPFARALAARGRIYRRTEWMGGLLVDAPDGPPREIRSGKDLAPLIADRLRVRVVGGSGKGKSGGTRMPDSQLDLMLRSECFLQELAPVDEMTTEPRYRPDFTLTPPGYSDAGPGRRWLYTGPAAAVSESTDTIERFLDAMPWASNADRTAALAAALTVQMRDIWPGGMPAVLATANKSHAGKDTVIMWASGTTRQRSVSYQRADWPMEQAIVATLAGDPTVGVLVVENVRLAAGEPHIASGCLERAITSPVIAMHSTKGRGAGGFMRVNNIVFAISTNYGALSSDIVNRGLFVVLHCTGDIADRTSAIGNPKYDFIPQYRTQTVAELRGMVERWRRAGMPLDTSARHPFGPWAQTIGGILMVAGYTDFLKNIGIRKTADDPVRKAIGILGSARPDEWLPSAEWGRLVRRIGKVKELIPEGDRDTDVGHERGIGVVLSAHQDETIEAETEDERLTLRIEKGRRRWERGADPQTRYRFAALARSPIPADDATQDAAA
jgi:hypothetical protein